MMARPLISVASAFGDAHEEIAQGGVALGPGDQLEGLKGSVWPEEVIHQGEQLGHVALKPRKTGEQHHSSKNRIVSSEAARTLWKLAGALKNTQQSPLLKP